MDSLCVFKSRSVSLLFLLANVNVASDCLEVDMKILHHGATKGGTGSCHQLVIDEHNRLLVDCSLFQGADITEHNEHDILLIDFDINTVKALLVTHCHIDHVG